MKDKELRKVVCDIAGNLGMFVSRIDLGCTFYSSSVSYKRLERVEKKINALAEHIGLEWKEKDESLPGWVKKKGKNT